MDIVLVQYMHESLMNNFVNQGTSIKKGKHKYINELKTESKNYIK